MRAMREDDIDFALELTDREGWAYCRPEFERILRLPHVGSLIWDEGGPSGFVTSVQYGASAVIGHLVVSDEARGKKVGRKLLEASLRELDDAGVRSVLLFSTSAGERLYESCGFRPLRRVVSYGFHVDAFVPRETCLRMGGADMDEVCELDRELFGDDRSSLLEGLFNEYPDLCFKTLHDGRISGYVFARRTPLGGDIGPWSSTVGADKDARLLMDSVLSCLGGSRVDLGLFDDVPMAKALASDFPIVKSFHVTLMVRGEDRYPLGRPGAIGIVGFELG